MQTFSNMWTYSSEEYTKVVTLCVECITWKVFSESTHEWRVVISHLLQCTSVHNWY